MASETSAQLTELHIVKGSKIYGGVHAIEDLDFDVHGGEIHALLGENGSGKSTLCKAIAGAIELTSGSIRLNGKEVHFHSPAEALGKGITMVYQETSLVPSMTVAQNLELGMEDLFTIYRKINIRAQQSQESLNFHVNPLALVETLGTAQRLMVEIARAVRQKAKIIIFDEPTASLTPEEIQHLFHLFNRLRAENVAIIFISHAIEEALKMADRITILRDGKLITTTKASNLDRPQIVRMMVGRDISNHKAPGGAKSSAQKHREKVLSVENVTMGNIVKNMSFSVYSGEVLGIFGLVGAGRTEIAHIIAGVRKRNLIYGGMIYLKGKPIRYRVPRQAIKEGIVYITEDRKNNGFFETMTVDDNIYIGYVASLKGHRMLYSRPERKRVADHWVKTLGISALKRSLKIIEYSGGNQQKVTVAKSLAQDPSVIIFDEPTRGVDVGAITQIHESIRSIAAEGKAVVVISSYLPEILTISNRILVARSGKIVEEINRSDATEEKIMFAAVH
ncbi:MAG: sugar ABC transporter ATP-binding protein [Deltaproteobacteria bacterium]|nr:sugar ABC transporter ATP-binding protein [Deltaproteobacteria bacterium]